MPTYTFCKDCHKLERVVLSLALFNTGWKTRWNTHRWNYSKDLIKACGYYTKCKEKTNKINAYSHSSGWLYILEVILLNIEAIRLKNYRQDKFWEDQCLES